MHDLLNPKVSPVALRLSKALLLCLRRPSDDQPWQLYAWTDIEPLGPCIGLISSLGAVPRCP